MPILMGRLAFADGLRRSAWTRGLLVTSTLGAQALARVHTTKKVGSTSYRKRASVHGDYLARCYAVEEPCHVAEIAAARNSWQPVCIDCTGRW